MGFRLKVKDFRYNGIRYSGPKSLYNYFEYLKWVNAFLMRLKVKNYGPEALNMHTFVTKIQNNYIKVYIFEISTKFTIYFAGSEGNSWQGQIFLPGYY